LRYTVFDSRHKSLGSFALELTDEPAPKPELQCTQPAFQARPVISELKVVNKELSKELSIWWKDQHIYPSYSIHGRVMTVVLNGAYGSGCDDTLDLDAELGERVARGTLQYGGMFVHDYGWTVLIEKLP
jgi:hypothetical protein